MWAAINDRLAREAFDAERAVVSALGGGCQLPLGAIALHDGRELVMQAIVATPDGSAAVRRSARGSAARPEELGRQLAGNLDKGGALAILNSLR